jgi:hypothetical protein
MYTPKLSVTTLFPKDKVLSGPPKMIAGVHDGNVASDKE